MCMYVLDRGMNRTRPNRETGDSDDGELSVCYRVRPCSSVFECVQVHGQHAGASVTRGVILVTTNTGLTSSTCEFVNSSAKSVYLMLTPDSCGGVSSRTTIGLNSYTGV